MEDFCNRFSLLMASSRTSVDDLLQSAFNGDLAPFQRLVEEFKSDEKAVQTALGVCRKDRKTALHYAAAGGRKKVCKFLLEEGKRNINMKDGVSGETPLHHAIRNEKFATAVFLLENGADPNSRCKWGRTPLHYAAKHGPAKLIRLLLSKGAEINSMASCGTPLQYAAGKGKQDFVKLLLDNHADPNVISHNLSCPLLESVKAQSIECLKLFIQAGADINFRGSKGRTPLAYASAEGSTEIIKFLLNEGADPNIANDFGMTPIEEAAMKGKHWIAKILFPLTRPIPTIHEWSIAGILKQVNSDEAKEERKEKEDELFELSISKGVECFERDDYVGAVQWYTQAIVYVPIDADVLSERSLCWTLLDEGGLALDDAESCIKLRPDWPEAYYRKGSALMVLDEYEYAIEAFHYGCDLDPENEVLQDALREAIEAAPECKKMIQISSK